MGCAALCALMVMKEERLAAPAINFLEQKGKRNETLQSRRFGVARKRLARKRRVVVDVH